MIKTQHWLLIISAAVIASFLVWNYFNPTASPQPPQTACTLEAKICPDGSSVGRTGPNCEFEACPTDETPTQPGNNPLLPEGWQTYQVPEFGFSFNYPDTADIRIQESYPPTYVVFQVGPTQRGETELYDGLNVIFNIQQKSDPSQPLNQVLSEYLSQQSTDGTTQVIQPLTATTVNGVPGFTYTIRGLGEFTTVAVELPQEGYYLSITNGSTDPEGVTTFDSMSQTIIDSVQLQK